MRTRSRELMTARRDLARTLESLTHCRADGDELVDYVPHFLSELERQARQLSKLTLTSADRRDLEDSRGGRLYVLDSSRSRIRYDRQIDATRVVLYCGQCENPRQGDSFGHLCGICAKAKHSTHAHPGNCVCETCLSASSPSSSGTDVPLPPEVEAGIRDECHKCGQMVRVITGDRLAAHDVGLGPCPGSGETVYRTGDAHGEIYRPDAGPFAELELSPYAGAAPVKATPARLPRASCGLCTRSVAVRNGGELREHTTGGGGKICPGSGYSAERTVELQAVAEAEISRTEGIPEDHVHPFEVYTHVEQVPDVVASFVKGGDTTRSRAGIHGWRGSEALALGGGFYLPGELETADPEGPAECAGCSQRLPWPGAPHMAIGRVRCPVGLIGHRPAGDDEESSRRFRRWLEIGSPDEAGISEGKRADRLEARHQVAEKWGWTYTRTV